MTHEGQPAARGTRGPTTLTVIGAVTLVLALVIGIFAVIATVRTIPTGVLTMDGRPGEDVHAVIAAPGYATVDLEADVEYSLMLVGPSSGSAARLEGQIVVTGPDADAVRPGSAQSMRITMNNRTAHSVGTFRTVRAGEHTIEVPAADQGGIEVFLAEDVSTGQFVAGVFGGVLGILLAVFLGIAGVGLLVGGIVWRVVRKRSQPAGPHAAPPLH